MKSDVKGLYDYHMHSIGSFDGQSTVDELAAKGIALGLKGICLTEHHDSNRTFDEFGFYNHEKQAERVAKAKGKYGDRIEIYSGLEVDFEPSLKNDMMELVSEFQNLDVKLGSVHVSCFGLQFNFLDSIGKMVLSDADFEMLYRKYYDDIEELIRLEFFDVIAHIDYPKRCGVRTLSGNIPSIYYEGMERVMELAAKYEIAVEINTRNADKGAPLTAPEFAVKKYIECGGKYVTLGSDTHYVENLANSLYYGYNILEKYNIGQTIFKDRTPYILPLLD